MTPVSRSYVLALLAAAFASGGLAASAAGAARPPRPPVLREVFTRLPCPAKPVSTLDLEACQEVRILASDAKINALAKAIFPKLLDNTSRGRFVAGEKAWLAYRTAFCQSQSDVYEGGTAAGIVYASCAADVNDRHVTDLTAFRTALAQH